ncbi:murein biosynthesis integral membrane protein MurJ [Lautropia dentalis]|uniref:murein biosynthesis integral membrane protein MurJ n=1 Tax=Lautropia dentalis TaxID=2490857 RepID=UPI001EEFB3AA|nr:murein biosynthesis integral membrane protein MurJ [Lautropia dentalis]
MNLLRAAATISGLTLVSRVLGLVRETLVASVYGAGPLTDAFFVAFRLPNMLRRLFAEGAFTQAFIPVLAQSQQESPQETRRVLDAVATMLFWVLTVVVAVGVVAAPGLVWLVASGLRQDAETFGIAVLMTRWMFPYILLISLVALAAAILNLSKRFAAPAFAPVLLNVSIILAALFLGRFFDPPVLALCAGVMIGGVLQLLWQVPSLVKIGLLPRIRFTPWKSLKDPAVQRVLKNMAPTLLAVSVSQFSLIINTQIASWLAPGSVSWVSYGDRLMEFPTSLLGIAMGTLLLPSLSQANAAGNTQRYSDLLDWGLRLALLLATPAMVGLALMAKPLTALLFHYGAFSTHDLLMTSHTVRAYGAGLVALTAVRILAPGFFAKQDVRTPVKIAVTVLVCTQLMNLVLVPWLAHAGLALSISLGAWLNAGWLLRGLKKRGSYIPRAGWRPFMLKVAVALAAMGVLLGFVSEYFDWGAMQSQPWLRIGLVLGMVVGGALLYFGLLMAMGLNIRQVMRPPAEKTGGATTTASDATKANHTSSANQPD